MVPHVSPVMQNKTRFFFIVFIAIVRFCVDVLRLNSLD